MEKLTLFFILVLLSIGLAFSTTQILGDQIITGTVNAFLVEVDTISNSVQNFIGFNGNRLVNVMDPVDDSDAATKSYVDSLLHNYGGGFDSLNIGEFLFMPKKDALLSKTFNQHPTWGVIDGENHVYYVSVHRINLPFGNDVSYNLTVFDKKERKIVDNKEIWTPEHPRLNTDNPVFVTGDEVGGKLYFSFIHPRANFTAQGQFKAFFRYDPPAKTLTRLNNLPASVDSGINMFFPRQFVAGDGTNLYAGVMASTPNPQSTAEQSFTFYQYDFGSDTWSQIAVKEPPLMLHAGIIGHHGNVRVQDGKIYWVANEPPFHAGYGQMVSNCVAMEFNLATQELKGFPLEGCSGKATRFEYSIFPADGEITVFNFAPYNSFGGINGAKIFTVNKNTLETMATTWHEGIDEPSFAFGSRSSGIYKASYLAGMGFDGERTCELYNIGTTSPGVIGGYVVAIRDAQTLEVIESTFTNIKSGIMQLSTVVSEHGLIYFGSFGQEPGENNAAITIGSCGDGFNEEEPELR